MTRWQTALVFSLILGLNCHSEESVIAPRGQNLARLKHTWRLEDGSSIYGVIIGSSNAKEIEIVDLETSQQRSIPTSQLTPESREIMEQHKSGILTGKVIRILDGDTIDILTSENRAIRIRLHGIDAPEKAQPFCAQSREMLKKLVLGKTVTVHRYGRSFYRITGTVYLPDPEGMNVNLEMIKAGLAWHSANYFVSDGYTEAENNAKTANPKKGLWAGVGDQKAVPPWEYRNGRPPGRKVRVINPRFSPVHRKVWVNLRSSHGIDSPFKPLGIQIFRPTEVGNVFLLNTNTNRRHLAGCSELRNVQTIRVCKPTEGKPCSYCSPFAPFSSQE
tara:strand:+ start:8873 stop:9868 length:996 start_codon:yes stop_codon:yes gene_type:complete